MSGLGHWFGEQERPATDHASDSAGNAPTATSTWSHSPDPNDPSSHGPSSHGPEHAGARRRAPESGKGRRRKPSGRTGPASRVAGLLGEVLITLGVLLGLYIVWQVWWTDVVAHRAASEQIEQWEMTLPEAPDEVGEPRTEEPPVETPVAEGEQFATMYVPAWGADWEFPIAAGVDYATVLDNGFVGHYTETALPGQLGNFGLAGHRQMYGRPFYAVDKLEPGDEIIVHTANAWYVYQVSDYEIIQPHEVDVLAPVPREPGAQPTERMITLTTCHPLWSIAERYVVYGELDHWVDPADGYPAALSAMRSEAS